MPANKSFIRVVESVVLLAIIAIVILIAWKAPTNTLNQATTVWLLNMGLLVVFTVIAGHIITGLVRGVLIDERNKISLSRLQLLLWTVLILSGFLTAVLVNIHRGYSEPLSIALHTELWALLGISTTSLVGSPLIKNNKKAERPNKNEEEKTKKVMINQGEDPDKVRVQGKLLSNDNPENARWTDMFKGEESGNGAHLDLGKIQMFFFTLVTWFAYAIAFRAALQHSVWPGAQKFTAFPDLDSGMVALLGISHAAYLANKAVPHTADPPAEPPAPTPEEASAPIGFRSV